MSESRREKFSSHFFLPEYKKVAVMELSASAERQMTLRMNIREITHTTNSIKKGVWVSLWKRSGLRKIAENVCWWE